MSDVRFDIRFDGTLKAGADPDRTRKHLGTVFKLDEQAVARLFAGKPVLIKRNVDAATAARYTRVFDEAGAVLGVVPLDSDTMGSEHTAEAAPGGDEGSGLRLAPQGGFLEAPQEVKMPELDLSHLSLISEPEWTLADCQPQTPEIDPPDTSHLGLADEQARPDDHDTR